MAGNDVVLEVPKLDGDVTEALVRLVAVAPGQDGRKVLVVVIEELCSCGNVWDETLSLKPSFGVRRDWELNEQPVSTKAGSGRGTIGQFEQIL